MLNHILEINGFTIDTEVELDKNTFGDLAGTWTQANDTHTNSTFYFKNDWGVSEILDKLNYVLDIRRQFRSSEND